MILLKNEDGIDCNKVYAAFTIFTRLRSNPSNIHLLWADSPLMLSHVITGVKIWHYDLVEKSSKFEQLIICALTLWAKISIICQLEWTGNQEQSE